MNITGAPPSYFGTSSSPIGSKNLPVLKQTANDKLLFAKLFSMHKLHWIMYKCCRLYI